MIKQPLICWFCWWKIYPKFKNASNHSQQTTTGNENISFILQITSLHIANNTLFACVATKDKCEYTCHWFVLQYSKIIQNLFLKVPSQLQYFFFTLVISYGSPAVQPLLVHILFREPTSDELGRTIHGQPTIDSRTNFSNPCRPVGSSLLMLKNRRYKH